MTFSPLEIDRNNLTIMGVAFPDLKTLEDITAGLVSNMFEGLQPTTKTIEIIRDSYLGKITKKRGLELILGENLE